jgi:hypothetical protein
MVDFSLATLDESDAEKAQKLKSATGGVVDFTSLSDRPKAPQAPAVDFSGAQLYEPSTPRLNLEAAAKVDPKKAAEKYEIAGETGLPPSVVEENQQELKEKQAAQKAWESVDGSDGTQGFFSEARNAEIAWDAAPTLSAIESIWNAGRSLASAVPGTAKSALSGTADIYSMPTRLSNALVDNGLALLGATDLAKELKMGRELIAQTQRQYLMDPEQSLRVAADLAGQAQDAIAPEDKTGLAHEVSEGLGQVATLVAMAYATGGASALLPMYMMFTQGVDQISEARRAKGIEPSVAGDVAALTGGAVTLVTERWGLKNLLERIPASLRTRFARGIVGAVSEASQEFAEQVLHNITILGLIDPKQEVFEGAVHSGEVAGIVGYIAGVVIPGHKALRVRGKLDEVREQMEKIAEDKGPDVIAEHFEHVHRAAGGEDILIPAQKLVELALPPGSAEGEYKAWGLTAEDVTAAVVRGGDVKVTPTTFVKQIMLTDNYEAMVDHVRFGEDGMTAGEAKDFAATGIADEMKRLQAMGRPATDEELAGMNLAVDGTPEVMVSRDPSLGPEVKPLPNAPASSPGPHGAILVLAEELGAKRAAYYTQADPERGKRIADAFDAMEHNPNDPQVAAAYKAFIKETMDQYAAIEKLGIKIDMIPAGANPYATPAQAIEDIRANKHLWVFPTEQGFGTSQAPADNPLLAKTGKFIGNYELTANDVFRIVHDIFGHAKEGGGFGPSGEENAWQAHVRMYSRLAARAMTTETRGQNSWVNFGPFGEANRANPKATRYADQKVGLLPEWVMTEGYVPDAAPAEKGPDAELASNSVQIAQNSLGLQGILGSLRDLGASPKEQEKYLVMVQAASQEAVNRVNRIALKAEAATQTEAYKKAEKEATDRIEAEVSNKPVYRAIRLLHSKDKLDRSALEPILSGLGWGLKDLPVSGTGRTMYTGKNEVGADPTAFAELLGYDRAEDMIRAIKTAPPIEEVVKSKVDAAMRLEHGLLIKEMAYTKAALEAVHTDTYANILSHEITAMQGAKAVPAIMSPAVVRKFAKQELEKQRLADIKPSTYVRDMAREGRLSGKLLRAGDRDGAVAAKFRQLLNFQYTQEAYGVIAAANAQRKYMKKFLRDRVAHRKIGADHVEQIRELVSQYDLDHKFSGLTLGAWNELHGKVLQLEAQGRLLQVYKKGAKTVEFKVLREELVETANNNVDDTKRAKNAAMEQNPRGLDIKYNALARWDAAVAKVEFLLRRLDGGVAGPWHQAIYQRVVDAQTEYLDMVKTHIKPVIVSMDKFPKSIRKNLHKKVFVPLMGKNFTRSELLMLALNTGNTSNYTKLRDGYEYSDAAMAQALSMITDVEMDWVQSVWDTFEKIHPRVEEIYRQEFGQPGTKIEPRPFTTASGKTYRGGYYPVMYDLSRAERPPVLKNALDAMENPLIRGGVYSGMTKERTEYTAPILLDLAVLPHALEQAVHFVSHYETVRDVRRVIYDPKISETVKAKLGGEYLSEMKNWMEAVATSGFKRSDTPGVDAVFRYMRQRLSTAVMGFSYGTMAAQLFGVSSSVTVLGRSDGTGSFSALEGTKWFALGMEQYLSNPANAWKNIVALSGEMRHRVENIDRDLSATLAKLGGKSVAGRALAAEQRMSLMTIGYVQLFSVDIPTWIGGFNKALAQGRTNEEAIAYADSVVRTSQGSGHLKDLSAIQRERGAMQAFTMFSTYLLVQYNLQKELLGDVWKEPKNAAGAMARFAAVAVIPAILSLVLQAEAPEDKDNAAWWYASRILGYTVNAIPLIGPPLSSAAKGFDANITAFEQFGRTAKGAVTGVAKLAGPLFGQDTDELDAKEIRGVIKALGLAFGVGGTFMLDRVLSAVEAGDNAEIYDYLIGYKKHRN